MKSKPVIFTTVLITPSQMFFDIKDRDCLQTVFLIAVQGFSVNDKTLMANSYSLAFCLNRKPRKSLWLTLFIVWLFIAIVWLLLSPVAYHFVYYLSLWTTSIIATK